MTRGRQPDRQNDDKGRRHGGNHPLNTLPCGAALWFLQAADAIEAWVSRDQLETEGSNYPQVSNA